MGSNKVMEFDVPDTYQSKNGSGQRFLQYVGRLTAEYQNTMRIWCCFVNTIQRHIRNTTITMP